MYLPEFQLPSKKELRQMLKADLLSPEILSEEVQSLQANLKVFLARQTGVWGGFCSLHPEPPIEAALKSASHITWAYPRIQGQDLQFYLAEDGEFIKGSYQIDEPVPKAECLKPLAALAGVLAPALGFDVYGRRLGRGGGYYDRLLQNWNGIKVGIALRSQILAELPVEAHDVRMDYLVTSAGVIHCGQQQLNSKVRGS